MRIFGILCRCFKGNSDRSRNRRLHWPYTFLPSPFLSLSGNIKNHCFSGCHGRFINTTYWNLFFYHIKVFLFWFKTFSCSLRIIVGSWQCAFSIYRSQPWSCLFSQSWCMSKFLAKKCKYMYFSKIQICDIYIFKVLGCCFVVVWTVKRKAYLLTFGVCLSYIEAKDSRSRMAALDEPTCLSLCSVVFSVTFSYREPCFCLFLNGMGNIFNACKKIDHRGAMVGRFLICVQSENG